jgi:hypothetical protein
MKLNIERFNPCTAGYDYYNGFSTFEKFWNKCYRGDWMLWLADQLEIDRRTLVRAAALCANTVRHLMKDERCKAAVDAAFWYADGEITSPDEMRKYTEAADKAAYDVALASKSVATYRAGLAPNFMATYRAALASKCAAQASYCPDRAAIAAYWASKISVACTSNRLKTANICREVLTGVVFEKVKQFNDKE